MTAPDVLQPSTPEEAVLLFEEGVTVIGGGTIVVPELTSGRLRPKGPSASESTVGMHS